jgi:hypothetical protein
MVLKISFTYSNGTKNQFSRPKLPKIDRKSVFLAQKFPENNFSRPKMLKINFYNPKNAKIGFSRLKIARK